MDRQSYDLCIIGGGINGAGLAADAAGRGLSVILCEQNDLASATSSKSTKLIHGGLRYLEYFEFRLVHEALKEREILWRNAPHLIKPIEFVMPYEPHLRPAWLIRAGLFLYDHLSRRKRLSKSFAVNFKQHLSGKPLKNTFSKGFIYSDCWVDDARLVVSNAIMAKEHGAEILTRTEITQATRNKHDWTVTIRNKATQHTKNFKTKILINASGPWVNETLQQLHVRSSHQITHVKGSHIIVPKLYDEQYAYVLQNADKRIVFVVPYQEKFTLIGTTEVTQKGPMSSPITKEEIAYLCQTANRYFNSQLSPKEIINSYSGVRPLHNEDKKNPSAISRDYLFDLNTDENKAPVLSIYGGKITTYRRLAEHALEKLNPYFPAMTKPWTAQSPLPGGDIAKMDLTKFIIQLIQRYPHFSKPLLQRYATLYGTRTYQLLKDVNNESELGKHFGAGLYAYEIEYLIKNEWAMTCEDIIWRRTKLGLLLSAEEQASIEQFVKAHTS